MPLETDIISNPPVAVAVGAANVLNVVMAALEVYTVFASAAVITLSVLFTYYAFTKSKKEDELLELELIKQRKRRKEDD